MASRWTFIRQTSTHERRQLVLDGVHITMGPLSSLESYTAASPAEAAAYADGIRESWTAEGFVMSDPESIPTDASGARRPAPPSLEGRLPERTRITYDRAIIELSRAAQPSLQGFRAVLRKIAEAKVTKVEVVLQDWLDSGPLGLLTQAMSEVELPHVTDFTFDQGDHRGADLGRLSALFECFPRLAHASVSAIGTLTEPVHAPQLVELSLWDSAYLDDTVARSLSDSRLPALEILRVHNELDLGAALRTLLEQAAPQLDTLEIPGGLIDYEALLRADAPQLTTVTLQADPLDELTQAIAEHGIPSSWRELYVSGGDAYLDEAIEFFEQHAGRFTQLEVFELDYEFEDTQGGTELEYAEAIERLRALCPQLRESE